MALRRHEKMSDSTVARADYGLDAPKVVRNLFVGGCVGL